MRYRQTLDGGAGSLHDAAMSLRAWLARLSFSFLILAFACAWTGQRMVREKREPWRAALPFSGSAACVVLGAIGVRMRHFRDD